MQVAYLLYDRFTPLDITGPHDVLNSVPGTDSVFVAENAGPVRNEWGTMAIVADRSLDEVVAPDIVVVPGGFGTRLLEHEPLLSWLRSVHKTTTWTTSVCTGSRCCSPPPGCSTTRRRPRADRTPRPLAARHPASIPGRRAVVRLLFCREGGTARRAPDAVVSARVEVASPRTPTDFRNQKRKQPSHDPPPPGARTRQ
jgi:hypothetical protein